MTGSTSASGAAFRVSAVLLAVGLAGGLELVGHAQQPPVFRSAVDLVAVDVQVMDADGNPIGKLGPDAFEVSINGKRRRVVSAEFIRHAEVTSTVPARQALALQAALPTPQDALAAASARTVILVVDAGSFGAGDIQPVTEAARGFLKGLGEDDLVGLYVYPTVTWIPPTTQRAVLAVRLNNLVGEKESLRSYYNLAPHEIVDITAQSTSPNSFLTVARTGNIRERQGAAALDPVLKIQARECPGQDDIDCASKIYAEGMTLATQLEREAQMSLSGLDSLLRMLSEMPGRKAVVLVSGGLLLSDRLDGRPDTGNLARVMGQNAARANATIYTVHIDNAYPNPGLASKKGLGNTNFSRDRAMLGNWLEDFSRSAGGKRIGVPVGGGEFAFERVLRETSAYYLLGVEPADVDRDGKPHELRVKVDRSKTTVRNRQWVVIPPRQQASRY